MAYLGFPCPQELHDSMLPSAQEIYYANDDRRRHHKIERILRTVSIRLNNSLFLQSIWYNNFIILKERYTQISMTTNQRWVLPIIENT